MFGNCNDVTAKNIIKSPYQIEILAEYFCAKSQASFERIDEIVL